MRLLTIHDRLPRVAAKLLTLSRLCASTFCVCTFCPLAFWGPFCFSVFVTAFLPRCCEQIGMWFGIATCFALNQTVLSDPCLGHWMRGDGGVTVYVTCSPYLSQFPGEREKVRPSFELETDATLKHRCTVALQTPPDTFSFKQAQHLRYMKLL